MAQRTFSIPTLSPSPHPSATPIPVPPVPVPFPNQTVEASQAGYNALWVVFAIQLIAAIAFTTMSFRSPPAKTLFMKLTSLVTLFAAISYYSMAAGFGNRFVANGLDMERQVFWARYVDWAVTTPLLLMDLMFLAGMPLIDLIMVVIIDEVMVLTGLFAALIANSDYKWGFYAFSCVSYLYVVFKLAMTGRRNATVRGAKVAKLFNSIALFVLIVWSLYPVAWAISEGKSYLNVDQEIMFYAVLDVLAKPVFGAWLLYSHLKIPETNVDFSGTWIKGIGLPADAAQDEFWRR